MPMPNEKRPAANIELALRTSINTMSFVFIPRSSEDDLANEFPVLNA
jgi:hypothetical protein